MQPNESDLDAQILAAHARRDFDALATLYEQAADRAASVDAECFFLTYAYVFALDAGATGAPRLHARLKAYGREQ